MYVPSNPCQLRRHTKDSCYPAFWSVSILPYAIGLRNAASTFERFIDVGVRGLDFIFAYINDLLRQ